MATVMIVDDSKTMINYHSAILKLQGLNIVEAHNGKEALKKSLNEEIDLYLVDTNMPIMDGYSFVADLRKQDKYKIVPVIMLAYQIKEKDRINIYKAGANLFEIKPIKPTVLQSYIDILLPN